MFKKILSVAFVLTAATVAAAQGGPPPPPAPALPPAASMAPPTAAPKATPAPQVPQAPHTNLKVGQAAPDFTLPSTIVGPDKRSVRYKLSDFRGKKNVVLAFYVFAFTGG
jgi:hypothetical protein